MFLDRLEQRDRRETEHRAHHHRSERVAQDVPEEDARPARTERAGREDVLLGGRAQHLRADEPRDLASGAADIAIRSSKQPTGAGLVGRRIADNPWTVYCSRDYADLHGIPHSREQLAAHPFIGGGGRPSRKVLRFQRAS